MSDVQAKKIYDEINSQLNLILNTNTNTNYTFETPIISANGLMDSVMIMSLIAFIEDKYGINIPENDANLDSLSTLNTLVNYIKSNAFAKDSEITIGYHLIINYKDCTKKITDDVNEIKKLIHSLAQILNVLIIKDEYHKFSPIGVTGFAIVSESHIAIHSWPEHDYLAIDIFSCKEINEQIVFNMLEKHLDGNNYTFTMTERKL